MIDEYEISSTNHQALGLADTPAALLLLARASDRATHYPANGARVIVGWADLGTGERWLTDEPVLWFDDQRDPVIASGAVEYGTGVESLNNLDGLRWAVYHPDARPIGDYDLGHFEAAVKAVHDELDADLAEHAREAS